MGIVNVTPDSFSDGGRWLDPAKAVRHGLRMVRDGASMVDVGGESTRPGAAAVPAREELRRVLPVVEALAARGVLVSVDTTKPAVARAAFRAGAAILNDVSALRERGLARAAADAGAAVVLMHMKGTPRTMQRAPRYRDVVAEILAFFRERFRLALRAGIGRDKIIVDPGIGFGKSPEHNVEILRRLDEFKSLGCPLAVGTSRKSFIGHFLGGRGATGRLHGTAATVAAAILRGADLVRVHDVREMADVARMADHLR
jgi:dihydropteroate synthase